jgi:hypothetical protein
VDFLVHLFQGLAVYVSYSQLLVVEFAALVDFDGDIDVHLVEMGRVPRVGHGVQFRKFLQTFSYGFQYQREQRATVSLYPFFPEVFSQVGYIDLQQGMEIMAPCHHFETQHGQSAEKRGSGFFHTDHSHYLSTLTLSAGS